MSEEDEDRLEENWGAGPEAMPLDEFKRQLHAKHKRQAGNKERITMRLDRDVLLKLKERAGEGSYQALINAMLREALEAQEMDSPLRRLEQLAERLEKATG